MIRLADIRAAAALTFVNCLVISGLALHLYRSETIDLSSRPVAAWAPSLRDPALAVAAPTSPDMSEALERPLFRMPREQFSAIVEIAPAPPPQPVLPQDIIVQPAPPAAEPPQFRLAGVSVLGKRQNALVTTAEDPHGTWIGIGDRLQNWEVVAISTTSVTMRANTAEITLQLYVDNDNEVIGTVSTPQ